MIIAGFVVYYLVGLFVTTWIGTEDDDLRMSDLGAVLLIGFLWPPCLVIHCLERYKHVIIFHSRKRP